MFVRLTRLLDGASRQVSVNTNSVTWIAPNAEKTVLLKMSDGPDMTVVGTLEEIEGKLNAASTESS
jgi:hypothetical protein